MKLIDSDALITAFENTDCDVCEDVGCTAFFGYSAARVFDVIDDAPIVDAVPVVRCKDCKHRSKSDRHWCSYWMAGVSSVGFCNHGESMSDEEFAEWDNTRRVWAETNGKEYKPCKNKDAMISWYNKMISADSAKYKAMGNSIATGPNSFWEWVIKRISAQYDRRITLGSLFDGVAGFPLVFEQINGKGSCRWASEIEPFPIAVTKVRFPDEEK